MTHSQPLILDTAGLAVPYLEQYFGVWAIEETAFRQSVDRARGLDLRLHLAEHTGKHQAASGDYQVTRDGIAVIELRGTLMKQRSSFSGGTSTVEARNAIRTAARDESVSGILLRIDSPGGTVAGTQELADDVRAAAARKTVYAQIEDLGASAAYWIASQAHQVYGNATAIVGSIGTFTVLHDLSEMAAKEGIKVHVIRAGDFKGAGTPGTEITDAQLAEWQRIVSDLNSHFLEAVAAGRKLPLATIQQLADGRAHVAAAALQLKLLDGVQSLDTTLAQLAAASKSPRTKGKAMSDSENKPQPATLADLRAACPGASDSFLLKQLEASATLAQAQTACIGDLTAQLKAKNDELATVSKERDDLKAAAAANDKGAGKPKGGVEPLGNGGKPPTGGSADAVANWEAAVAAKVAAGQSRAKAVSAVVKDNPEMHRAYLEAVNAK